MQVQRRQKTIARVCHVSGRGYWSGTPITVTFRPADENSGIVFQRIDLPDQPRIPVSASLRMETALRTRLAVEGATVDMVEHILSALFALQIDNCLVECTAREMPGMDGSSIAFAIALDQSGICEQPAWVQSLVIDAPHRIGDDRQWIMVTPTSQAGFTCEYRLDYPSSTNIPSGTFSSSITPDLYLDEIAPARTFVTKAEADQLQSKGLAKHVTFRDLLVFDQNGPIDNVLRFNDECARHKLLDLIGDLALCGVPICGKVIAYRSGHILNGRMAAWLEEQARKTVDTRQVFKRAA